jgi:arginyl-tRNA--protein-N-Asp/Glu arginylyltransferase
MNYLSWNETTITDFSPEKISEMYEKGYVFTRKGKGVMQQTRSVRIDLKKFELSSENRRILKKTEVIELVGFELPYAAYDFALGKLAKDFYEEKFGEGTLSANKAKELMTDATKSNFNCLFTYKKNGSTNPVGYAICYTSDLIHHYSYPFYDLNAAPKDMGLGMMIRAIQTSKAIGHRYIYLGSLQRPSDTYKLQFEGLEWFDGTKWQTDLESVKKILASAKMSE